MRLVGGQLAICMATMLTLISCRSEISTEPPAHPNWNMDQQRRYDPQEPSRLHYDDTEPFFDDGRAMRAPVPGTVPHGWLLDDDVANEHFYEGKIDGILAAGLPPNLSIDTVLPSRQTLLERGQERFDIFCRPCHGGVGAGDGILVEYGLEPVPPNLHAQTMRGLLVSHFFGVMTNGVRTMPSYADQIEPLDRWAIAAYVRALQTASAEGETVR